jgi:hypothetical protein
MVNASTWGAYMASDVEKTSGENNGTKTLVAKLTPISEQVGTHVLSALKESGCVAVLSTIVPGFPADSVVSIPLSAHQMSNVGVILGEVQRAPSTDEQEVCIGFHCKLPEKDEAKAKG